GNAQNPITLTGLPSKDSTDPQPWGGIIFIDSHKGSFISFAKILGADHLGMANSKVEVEDSAIDKTAKGVHVATASALAISGTRISRAGENAMNIATGGIVAMVGCTIERAAKIGIDVQQKSALRAINSTISECETGIAIIGDDSIIESCQVKKCKGGIIVNQGGPRTVLALNKISETQIGIYCMRFASPRIYANTVTRSEIGLRCFQRSDPEVENNIFEENKTAILCVQMCNPGIVKNRISKNEVGIHLTLSSYAKVEANNIEGNKIDLELEDMSADWERRASQKPVRSEQARNEGMTERGRATPQHIEDSFKEDGATVNARGNWWGEATTAEMNKKGLDADISTIKDFFDLPKRTYEGWGGEYIQDKVDYSGFLAAPVVGADVNGYRPEDKK
ncbi:right-handed parallel beta-helix repeat-containing protein, partial [bacterium]